MKFVKIAFLILISVVLSNCADTPSQKDLAAFVNPFIGTIGGGNTFQGPVWPYGMIQPGPYLKYADDMNSGTILGFSQTHLSGMAGGGDTAPGDVLFMPAVEKGSFQKGFPTPFQHANETASPGYYKIKLDSSNINVEITTTTRTALYKITFPGNEASGVFLKLDNGFVTVKGNEISGCNNGRVYFVARFSKPFKSYDLAADGKVVEHPDTVKSGNMKGFFRFDTNANEPIMLKVAISMVSVAGALNNLETEMSGWNFDQLKENARDAWNKELNKIQVEGGTKNDQIIFYTSLYHSMIHPNLYMDADRKFRSTNGKVYTATDFDNYTNFSLWDTFRALHPLYTIINQKLTSQFIRTFLERYVHNGRMLIMEFDGQEGSEPPMIGYHSVSVLADAYVKGIRDYDMKKAFKAAVELANDSIRPTKKLYLDYGFIPSDLKGQSVSQTLEFAYDDWCITRLAKDFNKDEDLYFSERAGFWKNVFSPEVNFMQGRKSNFQFVGHFDPLETINHYTEANAYQYSTFVLQDIDGLISMMGGDKVFEAWLDSCFTVKTDFSKINLRDVTGLIGQYAHGNEPSHHIAYLYNYAGVPWKTQKWVRQILSTMYSTKQDGIAGNEDCGQMSAWYVMSAMGIYAVTPGMEYYVIGSPLFDKVTINLENGKKFEIVAKNNSAKNVYIQSASLNGNSYSKSCLKQEDMMNGGKLVFEMGDAPNKSWASEKGDRPYSPKKEFKFAQSPKLDFSDIQFLTSQEVKLSATEPDAKIYYTLDGSEPTEKSTFYSKPIIIIKLTVLKTRSFVPGIYPSYPITVHFRKIPMLDAVNKSGLKPGAEYLYREGPGVMSAKDQKAAPVLDTGILRTFNVDAIKDDRPFGYNLSGYLKVPETGVYTFWLEANDGAVLYLNGKLIIDNDGGHREQVLDSKIGLKKGWHPINIDYFQQGLAKALRLTWEGPGVKKQEVSAGSLFH